MKKTELLSLLLSLAMALSLTACSSGTADSGEAQENTEAGQTETTQENTEAGQTETAQENREDGQAETAQTDGEAAGQTADLEDAGSLSNDGLILPVPEEYRDLLVIETPQDDENGSLFNISEKASAETAEFDGVGWICSISRVSQDKLHEMLCYDMSGTEVMAKDGDGSYYLYLHPTDVRIARAGEITDEDMRQWSTLNEWALTLTEEFPAVNDLTPETRSHTELDMYLSRIAYMPDTKYTISTTEYGPLEPGNVDPASFVVRLAEGVTYEVDDSAEAPDGEYVVLNFPEDNIRFDFFSGDETCIRQVWGVNGENELLYRADLSNGETSATAVMQEWYDAIAASQGLSG